MKYKAGDKVRIRKDLKTNKVYGFYEVEEEMQLMAGEFVTIMDAYEEYDYYEIEEDYGEFAWSDEMFEDAMTNADRIRVMSDEEFGKF